MAGLPSGASTEVVASAFNSVTFELRLSSASQREADTWVEPVLVMWTVSRIWPVWLSVTKPSLVTEKLLAGIAPGVNISLRSLAVATLLKPPRILVSARGMGLLIVGKPKTSSHVLISEEWFKETVLA